MTIRHHGSTFFLTCVLALSACGGEPSPGGPGGSSGDAGGRGGSGTADSGNAGGNAGQGGTSGSAGTGGCSGPADLDAGADGGAAEIPLLDRPAEDGYACTLTRAMSKLGINPWGGSALLPADEGAYLARIEGPSGAKIVGSTLFADGTLGPAKTLHEAAQSRSFGLVGAKAGDRFTLVWTASSASGPPSSPASARLHVTQVDAAGSVVTAPRELGGMATREDQTQIVVSGTGYGVAWVQSNQTTSQQLMFARLDENAVLSGAPVVLVDASSALLLSSLVAVDDGYAVAYAQLREAKYQVSYLALDSEGKSYRAPVELSSNGRPGNLVKHGEEVLAAWMEKHGSFSYDDQSASITIRVGRFDRQGNPIGCSYPLQTEVLHQENVDPRWFKIGNDLGLFWAQGKIIYICAGCVPDDRIKFVILSGANLARRSEVLELPSPTTAGGLLQPQAMGPLSSLLLVSNVTYHVSAEGASATISCQERSR